VAIIDLESKTLLGAVEVGIAPFAAAVSGDGLVAYVSNWGGRKAGKHDRTAPAGAEKDADPVVVDARGIAASGTVSRVDLLNLRTTDSIPVGLHPTALAWDQSHNRLYIANSNSDSISVLDTARNAVVATCSLASFVQGARGVSPNALALAPDMRTLYIACGGLNAVMVVDARRGALLGMIPTAWYPNALAISADGSHLAVAALLGIGSGSEKDKPDRHAALVYRGAVTVLEVPQETQLASYSTTVLANNHLTLPLRKVPASTNRHAVAIPSHSGDPSLIQHVVYIIKENRTYDSILGDLGKGNSDPNLVMYGRSITPNIHRLAEEFVLLDNLYATGGDSGDGHQWVTQANETAYCLWPGYIGRSYPFDGSDPIAPASRGFIWDLALAAGRSARIFGEYAGRDRSLKPEDRIAMLKRWKSGQSFDGQWNITSPMRSVNKILERTYPPYTLAAPDVVRAQLFKSAVSRWEASRSMPNLVILQLPGDHTYGLYSGTSTPEAMLADNDFALGQIVEALSHSSFWPQMAIFVVEDDSQFGVDHVDGHRTVALAVSPYIRRGAIDSTFYSQPSILKTIELILGLPTLSLFDLIANDMKVSFQNTPDMRPYSAATPAQSLFDVTPAERHLTGPAREAAVRSRRMRWDIPDAAPSSVVNGILWHQARGWKSVYPGSPTAVFSPMGVLSSRDRD
jgi:YVTN family beta-propeller protein